MEINFPSLFYSGIRSVFVLDNEYFALGGFVTQTCKYAAIFRLRDGKNLWVPIDSLTQSGDSIIIKEPDITVIDTLYDVNVKLLF